MTLSIRRRLLLIAALGVTTCVLAIYAVSKPFSSANRQRVARAEAGIERELHRLTHPDTPAAEPPLAGIRSGRVTAGSSFAVEPPLWAEAPAVLRETMIRSERAGGLVVYDRPIAIGRLFVGMAPVGDGEYAWAAYVLTANRWAPVLRVVVILLVTSLILVLTSLHAIVTLGAGARSLTGSLAALGKTLDAPVAQPRVRELRVVAEGIEQLARALAESQAALAERERLAVLGRVTAGLAHELRNPLASIKLQIDLVCRDPGAPRETVEKLADVSDEISRLDRLINDLLTVAGRRTGPREDTDLADLVRRRVALLGKQSVDITVTGEARARIDRDAIARVIDNVVRNAIEASPVDGRVAVEIADAAERACVRVCDAGTGVPDDRVRELFEPFFTTKPDGVGLGLALSRAIATAHGGALVYRRAAGKTVFELSLPRGEPS